MYFHLYSTKKFFADPNSDQHNTSSVKKSFGRYEVTLGTIKANSQLDCLKGLPDGCNESASVDDGLGVDQFDKEIELTITSGSKVGKYLIVRDERGAEIKTLQHADFVNLQPYLANKSRVDF